MFRGTLIHHGSCGVIRLYPLIAFDKRWSVSCLITHRPTNDTGLIFVSLHHALDSIQMHGLKFRFISGCVFFFVMKTMTFNIGLINYINTILVAQLIPVGVIGIMRRAYGIDIIGFHDFDILSHGFFGNHMTCPLVVLMTINAFEQNGLTID